MKAALAFFLITFHSLISHASGGDDVSETTKSFLAQEISRQLSYHHLSSQMSSGIAFAEVMIDDSGKFVVLNVNAATLEERELIRKEIELLKMTVPSGAVGRTFAFRFEFVPLSF